jgi:hypothetical protein
VQKSKSLSCKILEKLWASGPCPHFGSALARTLTTVSKAHQVLVAPLAHRFIVRSYLRNVHFRDRSPIIPRTSHNCVMAKKLWHCWGLGWWAVGRIRLVPVTRLEALLGPHLYE